MLYKTIILLFLSSIALADTYTTKFNPFTGKLDYVNLTVSSATYATTIAPQQYYYFDSGLTTYFYYNGIDTVYLYVAGQILDSWTYSQTVQYITYQAVQLTYNGSKLTYTH